VSSLEQVTVGTDDDGDAITSCIIRNTEKAAAKDKEKVTGPASIALRILHDTLADAGETPHPNTHIPPNTRTIREEIWRANCYAGMSQDDTTPAARQKAFVRASNRLQEKQLIGKWGELVSGQCISRTSRTYPGQSGHVRPTSTPDRHGHPPIRVSSCPGVRTDGPKRIAD
jgi:hypothetical protein